MATAESYPHGTCADIQQDANASTSATWTAWAEEATAGTFNFWIREEEGITSAHDDVSTPARYTPPEYTPPEYAPPESKPEPEEARLAREREEEREEEKAEHKAQVLLLELIGRVDYKKFCRAGYMDVEGNSGKVYRISPGAMTRVFAGKDKLDVELESLCIVMQDRSLPKADEMVWKKLMIESDEKTFVKTANHFN